MGNQFSNKNKPDPRVVEVLESINLGNHHFSYKKEDICTKLKGVIIKQHSWTYLHLAVWKRKKAIVNSLIEFGFNINAQDDHGETPLHLAAIRRDCELYKMLLDAGSLENIKNKNGKTPHDYLEEKGMGIITQNHGVKVVTVKLENSVISHRTDIGDSYLINEW